MVANPRSKPEIDLPAPDAMDDEAERAAVLILACAAIRREWTDGDRRKRRSARPPEWHVPLAQGERRWNGDLMGHHAND